jgi:hypothetical protein
MYRERHCCKTKCCGKSTGDIGLSLVYILGLSSDATVLTPNTESSCDLMSKTKSTSGNDDSTSLDLEWEDEEGTLYN